MPQCRLMSLWCVHRNKILGKKKHMKSKNYKLVNYEFMLAWPGFLVCVTHKDGTSVPAIETVAVRLRTFPRGGHLRTFPLGIHLRTFPRGTQLGVLPCPKVS